MKLIYSFLFSLTVFVLNIYHAQSDCEYPDERSGVLSFVSDNRRMRSFAKCWYISVPDDNLVHLSSRELLLGDPYCDYVYIEVSDDVTEIERICPSEYLSSNTNWTGTFLSSVNVTLIVRQAWDYITFKMDYHTESVICAQQNHFRCSPHHCIHSNQVCDRTEDCENGLDESECGIVEIKGANVSRLGAIRWLKSHQNNFGWGRNTHRAITALYLTDAAEFRGKKTEDEFAVKQLELKTAAALLKNSTDALSANELSMYVNALTVTCRNSRNLFAHDLLKLLARRTFSSSSANPGAYLTLCNANWPLTRDHVRQLLNLLTKKIDYQFRFEFQAMTIMAISCIKQKTDFFDGMHRAFQIYNETLKNFMLKQQHDGSFGNAHTTAMVTQALVSSGETENRHWSLDNAMQYLMKSLNSSSVDFLSVYLTLPLFKGKTLLDIGKVDCGEYQRKLEEDEDILDVLEKLGGKIYVQYSLYVGDHKDVIHTIYLRVPENSTAYDVMNIAQKADPKYKFSVHEGHGHVYVYEIAGITNDMEAGKFWFFYSAQPEPNKKIQLEHYTTSPDQITVSNKDHLIMWYKTANI